MRSACVSATAALLSVLWLLSACSSDEEPEGDGAAGAQSGAGGSGASGNGGGGGSGGGGAVPACVTTCAVPADCAVPNGGSVYDADNFECNGGRCAWRGCNSTTECTDTFMSAGYVCAATPGTAIKACYATCGAAADCAVPNAGALYDADNFACQDGHCEWLGCKSTVECTDTFMSAGYVCAATPGTAMSNCYPTCSAAADCAIPNAGPLYEADNYACDEGRCLWLGCNSTGECTDTFMMQNLVCD